MRNLIIFIVIHLANTENGTINGALWQPHLGSMADWNYEFAQCLEITVFTGCCHSPSEDTLLELWKAHYPALVASIQQVIPDNCLFLAI